MKKSLKKENEENAHHCHSADAICVSDSAAPDIAAGSSNNNDNNNDDSHEQTETIASSKKLSMSKKLAQKKIRLKFLTKSSFQTARSRLKKRSTASSSGRSSVRTPKEKPTFDEARNGLDKEKIEQN